MEYVLFLLALAAVMSAEGKIKKLEARVVALEARCAEGRDDA